MLKDIMDSFENLEKRAKMFENQCREGKHQFNLLKKEIDGLSIGTDDLVVVVPLENGDKFMKEGVKKNNKWKPLQIDYNFDSTSLAYNYVELICLSISCSGSFKLKGYSFFLNSRKQITYRVLNDDEDCMGYKIIHMKLKKGDSSLNEPFIIEHTINIKRKEGK